MPVFIKNGDDSAGSIQSSNFKPVWAVLNALKSHDEELSFELDNMRTSLGRESSLGEDGGSFSKIVFDLPITVNQSFSNSLKTYLVEETTSTWNFWFGLLEKYKETEGDVLVPSKYKTDSGLNLGFWVVNQRVNKENLDDKKIAKLNFLGFVWNSIDEKWKEGFSHLKEYFERKGNTSIVVSYVTKDGYKLGSWAKSLRKNKDTLSQDRKSKLESIGFEWEPVQSQWEKGFSYLKSFIEQKGNNSIPIKYVTKDGFNLGSWIAVQRRNSETIDKEKKDELDSLGFDWDPIETQWETGFYYLKEFKEKEGHLLVVKNYKTETGFRLGNWVSVQRQNQETLDKVKKTKLDSLGFDWDPIETQWNHGYAHLKRFYECEGNTLVPSIFKTEDDFKLGSWASPFKVIF